MPKVAINSDFGGFNLSDEAFEALLDRKGVKWIKSKGRFDMSYYYTDGHSGDDEHYIDSYDYFKDRADPDLVAVIEQFGDKANGWCSSLKIVEVPDGAEWFVADYDGQEWVAEKHRTWK